ncbi:MAG: hypothetical protein ACTSV2_05885 [Candidatus Thorarchaeota archaeon]
MVYPNSINGPAETRMYWESYYTMNSGPFGESLELPTFYDFTNPDDTKTTNIATNLTRRAFPMTLGQTSSVAMEEGYNYFGALDIGTEEFIHVTITSNSDYVNYYVNIMDPAMRTVGFKSINNGDIAVIPLSPTMPGIYSVLINFNSVYAHLVVADILPEVVSPELLPLGELFTGELSGSEMGISNEEIVYTEKSPSAKTYKVESDSTLISKLSVGFNTPASSLMPSFNPYAYFTGDVFTTSANPRQYYQTINNPGGSIFHRAIQEEAYYITLVGFDTDYVVSNILENDRELPVNEEFYFENMQSDYYAGVYSLTLDEDSVMRINCTSWSDSFWWKFSTVTADGFMREFTPGYSSNLYNADMYYSEAGEYIVQVNSFQGSTGLYEFNIGPVYDTLDDITVINGRVAGFRTDVDTSQYYNVSVSIDTVPNMDAATDYSVISSEGYPYSQNYGLVQSDVSDSTWFVTKAKMPNQMIIALCPEIEVNGVFAVDFEAHYSADFQIVNEELFEEVVSLSMTSDTASTSITLPLAGSVWEEYRIDLECESGFWYNVSYTTLDVADSYFSIYQPFNDGEHLLTFTDLAFTTSQIGSTTEFQFGSLNTTVYFQIHVNRDLSEEGYIQFNVEKLETNQLVKIPALQHIPGTLDILNFLTQNILLIGVGVVVVVAIVVIIKRRQ